MSSIRTHRFILTSVTFIQYVLHTVYVLSSRVVFIFFKHRLIFTSNY